MASCSTASWGRGCAPASVCWAGSGSSRSMARRSAERRPPPRWHRIWSQPWTTRSGVVLGQVQVAVKSNEIPALRTLLEAFDLVGAVVTADAMHTQTATAAYITARGGQPQRLIRRRAAIRERGGYCAA